MADILDQAVTAARKACPFANADMLRRALQAAAPHIAAAERERIRQLVTDRAASTLGLRSWSWWADWFVRLLDDQP